MKGRNLDVIHSGLVLISDGKGRGRPARLILTKDQLAVQVHASNAEDVQSICGVRQAESTFDMTLRTVNVPKGAEGLGLSIKGGSDGVVMAPVVVSRVLPNLPAALTGQIFVGDSIVEINGLSVEGKTHEEVVHLLKDAPGQHVTLSLKHDSQMAPLLRTTPSTMSVADSIVNINLFKSALKTPQISTGAGNRQSLAPKEEDNVNGGGGGEVWKTINQLPLPMAIVSRYLWGTDKLRNNAFELRTVDGRSSSIIHCEDRRALEQWIAHIDAHIQVLNKKSIKMSNRYLHSSEKISYIGWVEERVSEGTDGPAHMLQDPKQKWQHRFIIFKGDSLCIFSTPPLNSEELEKCLCLYKVYESALRTAIKRRDRRDSVFCLDTAQGTQHYLFLQRAELQQFEAAWYSAIYKSVNSIQSRTFACSYEGRPAGLVLDIKQGISLYDIPTKCYIWQYRFNDLESSSDDGKMRIQLVLRDRLHSRRFLETKEIECDQIMAVVFTLHSFYVAKMNGADPEFLKSLPLS